MFGILSSVFQALSILIIPCCCKPQGIYFYAVCSFSTFWMAVSGPKKSKLAIVGLAAMASNSMATRCHLHRPLPWLRLWILLKEDILDVKDHLPGAVSLRPGIRKTS